MQKTQTAVPPPPQSAKRSVTVNPLKVMPKMQTVTVSSLHKKLPRIEPPAGFRWKRIGGSAVLQPIGWYSHSNQEDMGGINYYTYAASPVDFSLEKPFRTGLTVQILRDDSRLYDAAADDLAALYLEPYIKRIESGQAEAMVFEKGVQDNYKTVLMRYKTAANGSPEVIVHKYSAADMMQNIVYIFTFESPADGWREAWQLYGDLFFANIKMEAAF